MLLWTLGYMCLFQLWFSQAICPVVGLLDHMMVSYCSWDSSGKNTGISCHALFQWIFPTQGYNPDFPHCRWILYPLSHQGIPIKGWTRSKWIWHYEESWTQNLKLTAPALLHLGDLLISLCLCKKIKLLIGNIWSLGSPQEVNWFIYKQELCSLWQHIY